MADCNPLFPDPVACVGNVIGGAVNSQVANMAKDLYDGSNKMFNDFFTSWVSDAPMPVIGGESGAWVSFVMGNIQVLLITVSLIVSGVVTMFQASSEPGVKALGKFLRAMMIQVGGATLILISVQGAKSLASWILQTANQKTTPTDLIGSLAVYGQNYTWAMIFGGITLLLVGIQWAIEWMRAIALTVVVPYWPTAAALAMFDKFEDTYDRLTRWIIAFIIYSPIAATLYGLAIVLKSGMDGIRGVIFGMVIMALAIAVLPALMKLVAPLATAVGNASAAGVAWAAGKMVVLATAAVGAAVITGGAAAAPEAAAAGAGAGAGAGTAAGAGGAEAGAAGAEGAAAAGEAGAEGAASAGEAGGAGATGASGSSGATGDGAPGSRGADGVGADGVDGVDGRDGADGAEGVDGRDLRGNGFAGQLASYMGQVESQSVEDTFMDDRHRG